MNRKFTYALVLAGLFLFQACSGEKSGPEMTEIEYMLNGASQEGEVAMDRLEFETTWISGGTYDMTGWLRFKDVGQSIDGIDEVFLWLSDDESFSKSTTYKDGHCYSCNVETDSGERYNYFGPFQELTLYEDGEEIASSDEADFSLKLTFDTAARKTASKALNGSATLSGNLSIEFMDFEGNRHSVEVPFSTDKATVLASNYEGGGNDGDGGNDGGADGGGSGSSGQCDPDDIWSGDPNSHNVYQCQAACAYEGQSEDHREASCQNLEAYNERQYCASC